MKTHPMSLTANGLTTDERVVDVVHRFEGEMIPLGVSGEGNDATATYDIRAKHLGYLVDGVDASLEEAKAAIRRHVAKFPELYKKPSP